jgi:hypothetical protein
MRQWNRLCVRSSLIHRPPYGSLSRRTRDVYDALPPKVEGRLGKMTSHVGPAAFVLKTRRVIFSLAAFDLQLSAPVSPSPLPFPVRILQSFGRLPLPHLYKKSKSASAAPWTCRGGGGKMRIAERVRGLQHRVSGDGGARKQFSTPPPSFSCRRVVVIAPYHCRRLSRADARSGSISSAVRSRAAPHTGRRR